MSTVAERRSVSDEVIGDYKIEPDWRPGCASVRKALGPWPLRNWSWIRFYDGSFEACREYVEWARRVDHGDRDLIDHASDWVARQHGVDHLQREIDGIEHLPKTWRYDFRQALSLFPEQKPAQGDTSFELIISVIAIPVLLICGFIYHLM